MLMFNVVVVVFVFGCVKEQWLGFEGEWDPPENKKK